MVEYQESVSLKMDDHDMKQIRIKILNESFGWTCNGLSIKIAVQSNWFWKLSMKLQISLGWLTQLAPLMSTYKYNFTPESI